VREHREGIGKLEASRDLLARLSNRTRVIKRDVYALYLVSRDARVPWYVKILAASVAAYALSPIDLIPDFVPVLGYLDDLIIVTLGLMLIVRMVPDAIMVQHRASAAIAVKRSVSKAGAVAIVAIWIGGAAVSTWLAWRYFSN